LSLRILLATKGSNEMQRRLKYRAPLFAFSCMVALGCGNKDRVAVNGVVTLDGQPVGGAFVKFVPVSSDGHEATAITDSAGKFSLGTLNTGDGAWRGSYKICVQKIIADEALESKMTDASPSTDSQTQGTDRRAILKSMKYKRNVLPRKYMNASTTPLEAKVPPDGPVRIEVVSEPAQATNKRG
jgi:hypothetical protein